MNLSQYFRFFTLAISLSIFAVEAQCQIITTVAGNTPPGIDGVYSGDGMPATASSLATPVAVALDTLGNFYIADEGNNRIRMVDTSGIIHTIAGSALWGFRGDDSEASLAEFCDLGLLYIHNNLLFIPDVCNNRVRQIDLSAQIVTTWAGNGTSYCFGDTGLATSAMLNYPFSVAADYFGNMYVTDGCQYLYKIDPTQHISRVAGSDSTLGCCGESGAATNARFNHLIDVAVDFSGNIYVTDAINEAIRKISPDGTISNFAGIDTSWGYSGDNGPATLAHLNYPCGIVCDGEGNVFFTDEGNNVIRRIDHYTNIITTVVGTGAGWEVDNGAFSGDNGPATAAELYHPAGLTFDKNGNLYFADWLNNRIRKVTNVGVPLRQPAVVKSEMALTIYPNPAKNTISVTGVQGCTCAFIDLLGRAQMTFFCAADKQAIDVSGLPPGQYIVEAISSDGQRRRVRMCKGG